MLAESANLLMMPGRAWDNDGWMKDSQRLYDAGTAAYKAAKARDLDKIASLSEIRCTRRAWDVTTIIVPTIGSDH